MILKLLHTIRWLFHANLRIRILPRSSSLTINRFDSAFNYQANHSWLVQLVLLYRFIQILLVPIGDSTLKKVLNWMWCYHTSSVNTHAQSRMENKMNWRGSTSQWEVWISVDSVVVIVVVVIIIEWIVVGGYSWSAETVGEPLAVTKTSSGRWRILSQLFCVLCGWKGRQIGMDCS